MGLIEVKLRKLIFFDRAICCNLWQNRRPMIGVIDQLDIRSSYRAVIHSVRSLVFNRAADLEWMFISLVMRRLKKNAAIENYYRSYCLKKIYVNLTLSKKEPDDQFVIGNVIGGLLPMEYRSRAMMTLSLGRECFLKLYMNKNCVDNKKHYWYILENTFINLLLFFFFSFFFSSPEALSSFVESVIG